MTKVRSMSADRDLNPTPPEQKRECNRRLQRSVDRLLVHLVMRVYNPTRRLQ